jgi:hypothetical protein
VWTREKSRGARFKVRTDVAVALYCEGPGGAVAVSPSKLEHEFDVRIEKATRLTLRVQNASGTRKARISCEVTGG